MSSRALVDRALEIALSYEGIRETAPNRGPMVDVFLRDAGLDAANGSYPWCCAFVRHCFVKAAAEQGVEPLFPRTASCAKAWERAPLWSRSEKPEPGCVFLIDYGKGKGHAGFVVDVDWAKKTLTCIEGNTNSGGSREGDGVYRRTRRMEDIDRYINLGKETLDA